MTERHTTQGRARGQKHGTLDRESVSVPHGTDETWARGNIHELERTKKKGGVAHVGPGQTIAGNGCWCGEPLGHQWKKGDPHPRGEHLPPTERPKPPKVSEKERIAALQKAGICPACEGVSLRTGLGGKLIACRLCGGAGVFPPLNPDQLAAFWKKMRGQSDKT